jgi:hypothetical protein
MDSNEITAAEKAYQITLSEHERMLLTASTGVLGQIERQERFILGQALAPVHCPACRSTICTRSANPAAKNGLDFKTSTPDDAYECPRCSARIVYFLTLNGVQGFTIHPDEARPVAK